MNAILISFLVIVFIIAVPFAWYAMTFNRLKKIISQTVLIPFVNVAIAFAAIVPLLGVWYVFAVLMPIIAPLVASATAYSFVMIVAFFGIGAAGLYYLEQFRRVLTASRHRAKFALLLMTWRVSVVATAVGFALFLLAFRPNPPPFDYATTQNDYAVCVGDDTLPLRIEGQTQSQTLPSLTFIFSGIYRVNNGNATRYHGYEMITDLQVGGVESADFDFVLPRRLPAMTAGVYEYRHLAITIWEKGISRPAGFGAEFVVLDCD